MALSPEQTKTLSILEKYPETQDMIRVVRDLTEEFEAPHPDQPVFIDISRTSEGHMTRFRWERNVYPPLTSLNLDGDEPFNQLQIRKESLLAVHLTKGTLGISIAALHLTGIDNPLAHYPLVSIQLSQDYPRVFASDSLNRPVLSGEWNREEAFSDLFLQSVAQFGLYQQAVESRQLQLAS